MLLESSTNAIAKSNWMAFVAIALCFSATITDSGNRSGPSGLNPTEGSLTGSTEDLVPSESLALAENEQVYGCKIYSQDSKCLFCVRDFYLENNSCRPIPFEQLIRNCNVYETATACSQCDQENQVASDGRSCLSVGVLNNCIKWDKDKKCLQCAVGSTLLNGVCSLPLPNCAELENPTSCKECVDKFYLSQTPNKTCLPVTTAIENCNRYGVNSVCTRCVKGFALREADGTCRPKNQVNEEIDSNCEDTIVSNANYCNICRQGYYLTGEVSTGNLKCETNDAKVESCYVADFTDNKKCTVCMPGYEMDNSLCVANLQIIPSGQTDPLSSGLFSSITVLVLGLLMLK